MRMSISGFERCAQDTGDGAQFFRYLLQGLPEYQNIRVNIIYITREY
jgi:hypothetical protein